MEATATGTNRSGAALAPEAVDAMLDAMRLYSPPGAVDTAALEELRAQCAAQADRVGSIPPPVTLKGKVTTGLGKMMGDRPELLMDKIGERLAFERSGVRLYEAIILKCRAALAEGTQLPPAGPAGDALADDAGTAATPAQEDALVTLARIRAEELAHFHLLSEALQGLGGDPTAQTPCADVSATASMGLLQVITDPRTTLAQSLNALLTVELTDNAGWELLIELAESEGQSELAADFAVALEQEAGHLRIVRHWLSTLLGAQKRSAAI